MTEEKGLNQEGHSLPVVIIAGGRSSRFWPLNASGNKALTPIAGEPLLAHTLKSLVKAGIKQLILVVNSQDERQIKSYFAAQKSLAAEIKYVLQPEALGQANAVLAAKSALGSVSHFLVLNAEQVNAGDFLKELVGFREKEQADVVLVGKITQEPWKYGVFQLAGKQAKGIIEKPAKGKEPSRLRVVGIYLLSQRFLDLLAGQPTEEYQLERSLTEFMKENRVMVLTREKESVSVKYPWDLLKAKDIILKFSSPKISPKAKIAASAVIKGSVVIEEDVTVGEFALIEGPAYLGKKAVLGAYSTLRGGAVLETNVEAQRYVDIKNSLLLPGAHVHSGFVGDSVIGSDCRIGAGFISANRRLDRQEVTTLVKGEKTQTHLKSFGVVIGPRTRLGIRVSTMPGVMIGADSLIGPARVLDKNIQDNSELL